MVKKDKKKKNSKGVLFFLIFVVFVLIGVIAFICVQFTSAFNKMYYATRVIVDGELTAPTYYEYNHFNPLYDVAQDVSNVGLEIYPMSQGEQDYHYDKDVYIQTYTSLGDDSLLTIARGKNDVRAGIISYFGNYYSFVGSVSPEYVEMVNEKGSIYGYNAEYSSGYINTGNVFKRNPLYIAAIEYKTTKNVSTLYVFSCQDPISLKNATDLIKVVAKSMTDYKEEEVKDEENTSVSADDVTPEEDNIEFIQPKDYTGKTYEEIISDIKNATITSVSGNSVSRSESDSELDHLVRSKVPNENIAEWVNTDLTNNLTQMEHNWAFLLKEDDNSLRRYSLVTSMDQPNRGEVSFECWFPDGEPVHAVIYSPDFSEYYEPVRYSVTAHKLYFYVVNPKPGVWTCALELKDNSQEGCSFFWRGITSTDDREILFYGEPYTVQEESIITDVDKIKNENQ